MATSFNEEKLINKLRWRIVPYIFLLYIIAMIDRVNIGFAALDMNKELGIDPSAFGMIAGIFFIAYFFFEVPSNVLMYKFGARLWIARILISWGVVTVLTAFVANVTHLTIARCLLGVAEAGFYPCMILYLTFWFPSRHLARTVSIFVCGMAVANIIAGPISTWIMDNVRWFDMAGWRWLFVLEGIPAIILGFITPFVMTNRPDDAKFLTTEEKNWLVNELQKEHQAKVGTVQISKWQAFREIRVWHLAVCDFCFVMGQYGLGLWMPQILRSLSQILTNTQIGLISTLPYICGAVVMILVARHSDKTMERRYHIALPLVAALIGLVALTYTNNIWLSLFWICISTAGIYSFIGCFWTLPAGFLSEGTAAVGIGIINSIANLGGFFGPYAVGFFKTSTGSNDSGMYFLAFAALVALILVLALPQKTTITEKTSPAEN